MRYCTDFMQKILQSANAQRIIDFIAPIYGESYVGLWLLEVIGLALDEVTGYAESLREQALPQTATWTLPYWEDEYNVTPDESWTEKQRQVNVLAKIKYVPPVNPAKLAEFASAVLGVPCQVIENVSKNTFSLSFQGYVPTLERLKSVIAEAKPAHLIWQIRAESPKVTDAFYVSALQTAQYSRVVLPILA